MKIIAQEFAKPFYNSAKWKKCRKSYIAERIAIDGGMCESCHQVLGEIVHHKEWLTAENINDPDVSLNHSNLKYDCHICHNKEEKRVNAERYFFDEEGQLKPYSPT